MLRAVLVERFFVCPLQHCPEGLDRRSAPYPADVFSDTVIEGLVVEFDTLVAIDLFAIIFLPLLPMFGLAALQIVCNAAMQSCVSKR